MGSGWPSGLFGGVVDGDGMTGLKCPYCHNDKAREDKYHAGTCENCGGILEVEGGRINAKPYSSRSYITQEQLEDCIVGGYFIDHPEAAKMVYAPKVD